MNKTIVIITHSKDNASIPTVTDYIEDAGFEVFRLDSDRYPTEFSLDARSTENSYEHSLRSPNGQSVNSYNIHAIWYRRFYAGRGIDGDMEKQMRDASLEESKRSLLGFLTCTNAFQMDDYWVVKKASNKDYQLKLARQIGLDIPATLVTNNPESARAFYDQQHGNIITKMQTAFSVWEDGVEKVVFTNPVEDKHLEKLDGLRQCPMVFQQQVEKQLELRATVVGNQVFCAAIDSNAHERMGDDWRKRGIDTLEAWQPYTLPEMVNSKLLQLTQALGLHYGAADIILTPDGRHVFLEINPCGEFFWMDHFTGLPICQAIAQTLLQGGTSSAIA